VNFVIRITKVQTSTLHKCTLCIYMYIMWSMNCEQFSNDLKGLSWSWSYGSWIYNYLCNQCRSPLKLWVRIPLRRSVLDTTVCDQLCQWLAAGRWFFSGTPISSTNKTCRHVDMTEILLKVALNTINPNLMVSTVELVQSDTWVFWHHVTSDKNWWSQSISVN
jgi:hypothetical protein